MLQSFLWPMPVRCRQFVTHRTGLSRTRKQARTCHPSICEKVTEVMLGKSIGLNRWFHPGLQSAGLKIVMAGVALASVASVHPLDAQASAGSGAGISSHSSMHYKPNRVPKREGDYFGAVWGIDSMSVKAVESGDLIRFSYRVLDADKARVLNDKKASAFLDAPAAGARLAIPSMEKVGQLRQGNTPRAGTAYWMAFSNPRRTVKRGDRVNVVIGLFHADGLVVE